MELKLKDIILKNTFIDQIRINMHVDESEYAKLCAALRELAISWRGRPLIEKELALELYSMPLMVRNTYLSFNKDDTKKLEIVNRLEDIWVELDELVTDCFVN